MQTNILTYTLSEKIKLSQGALCHKEKESAQQMHTDASPSLSWSRLSAYHKHEQDFCQNLIFIKEFWFVCRIVKLVRALRKGWIKRESDEPKEPQTYLMWDESGAASDKTATGQALESLPFLLLKLSLQSV